MTHSISTGLPNWRSISEMTRHNASIISGVRHCDRRKRSGSGCSVTPPRTPIEQRRNALVARAIHQDTAIGAIHFDAIRLNGALHHRFTPAPCSLDDEAIAFFADRIARKTQLRHSARAQGAGRQPPSGFHDNAASAATDRPMRARQTDCSTLGGRRQRPLPHQSLPEIALVLSGEACIEGIFAGGGATHRNR